MESAQGRTRRLRIARRRSLALALAVVALAVATMTADAQAAGYNPHVQTTVSVVSSAGGVTIYIRTVSTTPGAPGSPGSYYSSPPAPTCSSYAMNIGFASQAWFRAGIAQNPGTLPWWVNCSNGWMGIVWAPLRATPPRIVVIAPQPAVNPAVVAADLLATIPVPPISIGANPTTGLVALPAWFWVEGYDGTPRYGSRSLGSVSVLVTITPGTYLWSFGDGGVLYTGSPGRRYPVASDIQHNYQRTSVSAGGIYWVTLQVTFNASYRVNGGAAIPLAPIVRTYSRAYPVQQLQSVLTGP